MITGQLSSSQAVRWPAACLLTLLTVCWNNVNAAAGDLIWQDKVDGGLESGDSAEAVAVFGNMVFAVGFIQTGGVSPFAVRAYNANTGDLIWVDQPAGEPGEDIANDVHASAREVIVCGRLDEAKFGVVAYDRKNGELLWEDRSQIGSAAACDTHGKKVFVVGLTRNAVTGADLSVRVYDSRTGVLLWEDQVDGGAEVADQATALSIAAGQLYVVGVVQQTAGDEDMLVRRYDADTGALIWHQVFAGPVGERDEASAVAVGQNRVFVAGRVSLVPETFGSTWAVHAYHAATGELLWTDYHEQEEANDITIRGKRVVAAGGRTDGPAVVRAYHAKSGNVLWEDTHGQSSAAFAVDTDGQLAYWGGQSRTSPEGTRVFTVRAINLATGALVWQDLFGSSTVGGRVNDIVATSNRVYAVGHDTIGGVTSDFLARVYQAR